MNISYNLIICMIKLYLWNNQSNKELCYNVIENNCDSYIQQFITHFSANQICLIDLKNQGKLIQRDLSLLNTNYKFIICKNEDLVMDNRFRSEWKKLLMYFKELCVLFKNIHNLDNIIKEFWSRYEEFFHLLQITYKLNYIENFLNNSQYYKRQYRIMIEYFTSEFVYILYIIIFKGNKPFSAIS